MMVHIYTYTYVYDYITRITLLTIVGIIRVNKYEYYVATGTIILVNCGLDYEC